MESCKQWTTVIRLLLRSSVCLTAAESCHLFVFSPHERPLCSSPWDSQPSSVPIQTGRGVQFYFTVSSSLQQIFPDSVLRLLNCSVLSGWSKPAGPEIRSEGKGILWLSSQGVEDLEDESSEQQEESFRWILRRASFPGKFCQLPHNPGSHASKYWRLHFLPFPSYLSQDLHFQMSTYIWECLISRMLIHRETFFNLL